MFQPIPIPDGGKILTIQMQNDRPVMWVEVDPSEDVKKVVRYFARVDTGYGEVPRGAQYLGTTQHGSAYVAHWYEAFQS